MAELTAGSLFAGIGGFDLGFERAGIKTIWQVEINPYCRRILEKNFPTAERFDDVRTVGRHNLKPVDIICGGFPCQDVSFAGTMRGLSGKRSGLWSEYLRIICELRPRFVIVENVAALLCMGFGRVLGDLAEIGYDAEWDCIPAASVGSHHIRDRVFIVAYPQRDGWDKTETFRHSIELGEAKTETCGKGTTEATLACCGDKGFPSWSHTIMPRRHDTGHREPLSVRFLDGYSRIPEPPMDRMVDGLPDELVMSELHALGNAIVPQIAEWIGQRIVSIGGGE